MWYYATMALNATMYAAQDWLMYAVVDFVVKSAIREAKSDEEKVQIWDGEFIVLLFISGIVYMTSHVPVILLIHAVLTILYAHVIKRLDIGHLWSELTARWDDCEQHEESMEHHRQQRRDSPVLTGSGVNPALYTPVVMVPRQALYPTNTPRGVNTYVEPTMNSHAARNGPVNTGGNGLTVFNLRNKPEQRYNAVTRKNETEIKPKPSPMKGSHHINVSPKKSSMYSGLRSTIGSAIRKHFLPSLGVSRSDPSPPGLTNEGQNLCFMNAVLQCVARCPSLASRLKDVDGATLRSDADRSFCKALTDLFNALNDDMSGGLAASDKFRNIASQLSPGLVSPPGLGPQSQQDSAEFLTWLLDTVHNMLVNVCGVTDHTTKANKGDPINSSKALSTLKFIYGDLTPSKIEILKSACRREIALAHGLDTDSYAEPIQRLSDLEWLTYKKVNHSLVDDLFTGQSVDAQHCLECNRISVSLQTFNVLAVPIVEPRQANGIVYLEDCFCRYGNIESLFGREGLECENCQKRQALTSRMMSIQNTVAPSGVRSRYMQSTPFTANSMSRISSDPKIMSPIQSPIQGDTMTDSGFQDNHQRTSTPLQTCNLPCNSSSTLLTDGQRRSMLRQLPDNLVIQLMRYECSGQYPRKISAPVSVPIHNLDLTNLVYDTLAAREDVTSSSESCRFQLNGFCLHLGAESTSQGHYVSYSRVKDGAWYRFDDQNVSKVNIEYELTIGDVRNNIYLLFYRKQLTHHQ